MHRRPRLAPWWPPLLWTLTLPAQEAAAIPDGAPPAMAEVTADRLLAHAKFLASDELGGRLTGSPGQERAAKYIADHFAKLGLEPLGDEVDGKRTFFQRYPVRRTSLTDKTRLVLGADEPKIGFGVLGQAPLDVDVKGELRFVGRGRTRGTSKEVSDDEDLGAAVPLVLVKLPRGSTQRTLGIEQKFMLALGTVGALGRTAKALQQKGAKVVVFGLLEDRTGLTDVITYLGVSPGKDLMGARFPGADDGMATMAGMLGNGGVPQIVLSPELTAKTLAQLGIDRDAAVTFVDEDGALPAATVKVEAHVVLGLAVDGAATACNVVACLRGGDEKLRDEAIVFSAHMDHVGVRLDGDVYNGADDNASGSAGLLTIATAAAASERRPRRSLVFLSVSGEELGLWGSEWFAAHPTWPGTIAADVNTDMIGRSGDESDVDEVLVTPSPNRREFSSLVRSAAGFADKLGLKCLSGDKYYERSDHYNFAKRGIPVVFFCNGEHEDYHQVTDHADKLDGRKMQRLARLAFWTGWAAADADDGPVLLPDARDWK